MKNRHSFQVVWLAYAISMLGMWRHKLTSICERWGHDTKQIAVVTMALFVSSAFAEDFSYWSLSLGRTTTKEECSATKDAVWVEHQYGTECIRYYASSNANGAELAVMSFHGDVLGGSNQRIQYSNNSEAAQYSLAEKNAKATGVPWIKIARPGAYGSSGDHNKRRQPKEFYSLDAAVTQIKERLHIKQLILAGQSGGGLSVYAILTLGRSDVKCAVGSSAPYNMKAWLDNANLPLSKMGADWTGLRDPYDPSKHLDGIAKTTKMYMIGNLGDTNVPFGPQMVVGEELRLRGYDITMIAATGAGPEFHSLEKAAFKTAGWCAKDLSTEEIIEKVHQVTGDTK